MENRKTNKFKISDRLKSFGFAWKGILSAIREQHNFRIHLAAALLAILLGWITKISPGEWLAIIVMTGMVLATELLNSAIEELVDLLSPELRPLAGKVKDLAAGAVLVASIAAAATGLIVFIPHLFRLLFN